MPKASSPSDTNLGPCPICGREMIDGPSVDRHHWVPRREGGADWSYLHRICHKKLHNLFDERSLARLYNTAEACRDHPEVAKFVRWIRRKPPEYMGRHDKLKGR